MAPRAYKAFMTRSLLLALAFFTLVAAEPVAPAASADAITPLAVGTAAPAGTLFAADGAAVSTADLWKAGPTLVVFYRGSWCPFCNTHLSELAKAKTEIEKTARIVAISPDRSAINAPIADGLQRLSDPEALVTRAFGLGFTLDADTVTKYKGYGIDLAVASGHDHHILPVPAVFVIDATGVIRFAHSDPDYRKRLAITDIMKALTTTLP